LNGTSIVTDKKVVLTVDAGTTDGSIAINGTDYIPKNLKKIATSGLATDAVVTRAANSQLSKLSDPADTSDTNVQATLETLAGKVNTIQGEMVTSIDGGDTYSSNGVEITLDTDKTTGNVKVSVSSSNLDNVATLHYDSVNATTEDFTLYGVKA
jgi:hypothetical protein